MTANQFPSPCIEWVQTVPLGKLEPTYYWAPILKHGLLGIPALNFPPVRGVVFSGPAGNGRHTTAYALATTLRRHPTTPYYCLRISGCALDTTDVADACAVIDSVNAALNRHPKVCLLIDSPEDTRHSLAVQEYLYQLLLARNSDLFPILITDNICNISANMQRLTLHCHCQQPDEKTRQNWIQNALAGDPETKRARINVDAMNHLTIARETKGFSWRQLADLLDMMRLTIATKFFSDQKRYNPQGDPRHMIELWQTGGIHLTKDEVTGLIKLIKAQNSAPLQASVQYVPVGSTAVSETVNAETSQPVNKTKDELNAIIQHHNDVENMDFDTLEDVSAL